MLKSQIPVILGLDISTTCTGVAVIHRDTGELVFMDHVNMASKKKFPNFWAKVNHMRDYFRELHDNHLNWEVKAIAVEENMKKFPSGFSSAGTIMTLAKFNGILSYLSMEEWAGVEPFDINVRSARARLGIKINTKDKSKSTKQKVLDKVMEMNPDFPWVYREVKGEKKLTKINEDRADAWVIAAASRILHKKELFGEDNDKNN